MEKARLDLKAMTRHDEKIITIRPYLGIKSLGYISKNAFNPDPLCNYTLAEMRTIMSVMEDFDLWFYNLPKED